MLSSLSQTDIASPPFWNCQHRKNELLTAHWYHVAEEYSWPSNQPLLSFSIIIPLISYSVSGALTVLQKQAGSMLRSFPRTGTIYSQPSR